MPPTKNLAIIFSRKGNWFEGKDGVVDVVVAVAVDVQPSRRAEEVHVVVVAAVVVAVGEAAEEQADHHNVEALPLKDSFLSLSLFHKE